LKVVALTPLARMAKVDASRTFGIEGRGTAGPSSPSFRFLETGVKIERRTGRQYLIDPSAVIVVRKLAKHATTSATIRLEHRSPSPQKFVCVSRHQEPSPDFESFVFHHQALIGGYAAARLICAVRALDEVARRVRERA
jgi:hypothetical protein